MKNTYLPILLLLIAATQGWGQYCIPVPTGGTNNGHYIDAVSLGLINTSNTGVQGGPSYSDYTLISTNLNQNASYTVSVSGFNSSGSDASFAVWVDYNQDQDFGDSGEKLGEFITSSATVTQSISFTVPSISTPGITRMRVRVVANDSLLDQCTDYTFGETEDYGIFIDTIICPNISISATTGDPACGSDDGYIDVSASGGSGPYSYTWSNGLTTDSIGGMGAGTFGVTVMDSLGCWGDTMFSLLYLGSPTIATSATDISCTTSQDGSATVSVITGDFPFTYQWSSGGNAYQETNLSVGVYVVTVTDSNGCYAIDSATVGAPVPLVLTASITNPSTCGGSNGSATVTVIGGVVPYTYAWDDDSLQTTASVTGLSSGDYYVEVYDSNGCFTDTTLTLVGQGTGPVIAVGGTNVTCNSGQDGSATVTVLVDSQSPYSYDWSSGGTSNPAVGLSAGQYEVTVTDANGCTATDTVNISEPAPMEVDLVVTPTTAGECQGSATAIVTGGLFPYTFQWDDPNSQTNFVATGLCAGDYNVTVTDGNGCTGTATGTVLGLVGVDDMGDGYVINVFPNPSAGIFTVELEEVSKVDIALQVRSIMGQLLVNKRISGPGTSSRHELDLTHLAAGQYILELTSRYVVHTRKVVIE